MSDPTNPDGELTNELELLAYRVAPDDDGHSSYDSREEQEEATTEAVLKAATALLAWRDQAVAQARREFAEKLKSNIQCNCSTCTTRKTEIDAALGETKSEGTK